MSQRIALCFGYNGAGYFGLQRQPDNTGKPTIEQELEAGLLEVGALLARNAEALHRVNWSRTSRTDKGVSAAANVVAFDVPHACLRAEQQRGQPHQQHRQERAAGSAAASSSGNSTAAGGSGAAGGDVELAGLLARLNGALRAPIRVWGGVRVGQSFDARRVACGRRYEYLLPVWALDPAVGKPRGVQQSQQPQPQQLQRQAQDPQPASSPGAPAEPPSNTANGNASATAATTSAAAAGTTTAERSRMRAEAEIGASSFALSPTELKRLNLILGVFVGSHCFHNFTSEPSDDPESLRRTIHVARAEGPVYLRPSPETKGAAAATGPDSNPDGGGQGPGGGQGGGQGDGQGQGSPYVRIVFIGTGFLMHQIRRMVGLALAVARKAAPPDCIRAALDPARPHITPPTAPPTGLMMDRAYFSKESYDTARAAATAASAAAAPAATAAQATTGLTGSGSGSGGGGGGGGGGDGDWRRQLEALSLSGEAFKLRELYTAVCGAGPVEMFQFLCGLTDSAFGFRSWSKRPAGSAAATAAAAAMGKTAAAPPAAGRGGGAGGAGGAGGGAKTASEAGGAGAGATAAPAALAVAGAESVAGEGEGQPPPQKQRRLC